MKNINLSFSAGKGSHKIRTEISPKFRHKLKIMMASQAVLRAKYPKQELKEMKDLAASYESVLSHPKLAPGVASCGDSGHGDSITTMNDSIKSQGIYGSLKSTQISGSLKMQKFSKSLTSLKMDNSLKTSRKLSTSLNASLNEPKMYPNLEPRKKEVEMEEMAKLEEKSKKGKYDLTVIEGLEEIKEDLVRVFKKETSECIIPKGHTGPLSLQYTLETFTEARSTSWSYEPFRGKWLSLGYFAM
jgi:histidinol-phosphate/aromatic aminotransferase/cobyric acid decarboxylase-like protein